MNDHSNELTEVEIEHEGVRAQGTYRVLDTSVIVYFENRGKFAECGTSDPTIVAKALLFELMHARQDERQ